jgi:hypothetical protein
MLRQTLSGPAAVGWLVRLTTTAAQSGRAPLASITLVHLAVSTSM